MLISNREYNTDKLMALDLAQLLDQNQEEITDSWAAQIYSNASFHPEPRWLDNLKTITKQGLAALSAILTTESYDEMHTYLVTLSELALQDGFESSEVSGYLLLCKNAAMPVIMQTYPTDTLAACGLISALDDCLSWAVRHFNTLYSAEINQQIREQHKHITAMLQIKELTPEPLGFNEILHYIAEHIISALHVDHCDFYLVSEETSKLAPKVGIHRNYDKTRTAAFQNTPPDLTNDIFYCDILNQKQLVVCYDILEDPRINRELNLRMGTKSLLAVPLVIQGQVLAVAVTGTFSKYRTFTDDQLELVRNIMSAAALVIENARMHEKTRYMAMLEERERLAREIHDNLAQTLSIVNLQASHINNLLKRGETEQAQSFLTEMKNMVVEAHVDARDAIFSLRSGSKSMQEFIQTLHDYLEHYRSNYGVNTRLITPDDSAIVLPAETIIQLTRIIQEALTNVRKHAAASNVQVRLEQQSNQLRITIQDDGRGFDPLKLETASKDQVGLQVMRERTECLGGQMRVDTAPGQGTSISVRIPLTTQEMRH